MPPASATRFTSCASNPCNDGRREPQLSTAGVSSILRGSRNARAVSSAVEHYLDMVGVTSSILVPPTNYYSRNKLLDKEPGLTRRAFFARKKPLFADVGHGVVTSGVARVLGGRDNWS